MAMPQFQSEPIVEHGPERAPLVARLLATTSGANELRVRIEQNQDVWSIRFQVKDEPYLLLGFHPEGTASISVQAVGPAGATTWDPILHEPRNVPTSPLDMPPLQTRISHPDRMSGRFTFMTIRRRTFGRITDVTEAQRRWFVHWGMLLAIDNRGRMRWMRKLDRRAAGIERLINGNLFVHDTDFCSREIDVAGDTVRAWYAAKRPQGALDGGIPVDVRSLHHQPHQMPNGNFLALCAHSRRMKDWPSSDRDPGECKGEREIVGDMVVEFTPGGDIVWSWDSFDHLDPCRIGYDAFDAYWHVRGFPGAADWTHGNGVTYDERDDSVLVSLRLQDCILKIDRKSGDIVWILGDHTNWSPDLQKKLLRHRLARISAGPGTCTIRASRRRERLCCLTTASTVPARGQERIPFHKSFSRGVEFHVDEEAMTVEQVWASALTDKDIKERTWAMGDAHRFEDSDTALVLHSVAMPHGRDDIGMDETDRSMRYVDEFPSYARILEYSRKDIRDIVFDMTVRDENELIHWEVFSGVRVDDLYPEHTGVTLEFGDGLVPVPEAAT